MLSEQIQPKSDLNHFKFFQNINSFPDNFIFAYQYIFEAFRSKYSLDYD